MGKYFSDTVDQAIADIYYCYDNERARRAAEAVFQAAKNDGDSDAYYILARCFSGFKCSWEFHPFTENKAAASAMLNEAVSRGSAMAVLGAMRMDMLTPALRESMPFGSIREAWEIVKEKADEGCLFCQYMIGNSYYYLDIMEIEGISEQDFPDSQAWTDWWPDQVKKCLPYLESAYQNGMGWGGRNLVRYYQKGRGPAIPPDPVKALEWERVGAELGYPDWQYEYGFDLYHNYDRNEEGYQYCLQAVENGHLYAWSVIGSAYLDGQFLPQDCKAALECFAKAPGDDPSSRYQAGRLYFSGADGVPQDYDQAAQLLEAAYRNSDGRQGGDLLGICCLMGLGRAKDPQQGRKLLEAAAPSIYRSYGLGMMYAEGIGVREDIARGAALLKEAAPRYAPAKEALKHYKRSLFGKWRRV